MEITFRRFNERDLATYRSWFEDAELARRLSFPTDDWFAYVRTNPAARCWVAEDTTRQLIAVIQVDNGEDGRSYLDISLRPTLRGKGLGVAVLMAFIKGPGNAFAVLEGRIEQDNVASLACVRRCGFTILPGLDEDGLIRAERYRVQDLSGPGV